MVTDNLNMNIGKPKIRKKSAVSPNPDFRVKVSSCVFDVFLRAFDRYMEKSSMSLGPGAKPWDKMTDKEKETRRAGSSVKTAFARSQYAGGGGGGSPKYTSVIPAFTSPPVKTAGPPSEDKGKEASASKVVKDGLDGVRTITNDLAAKEAKKRRTDVAVGLGALGTVAAGTAVGTKLLNDRDNKDKGSNKSKTAGLTDTASEARAKVDEGKPGLLKAMLLGEFATGDHKFSKGTQKALVNARRDPRTYSNLRGMATLESRDKRVGAHKGLDRKKDHTILSAAKEGLTRGAFRKESMAAMRDELEKLNNVQDPQAQLSKHQGIGIPKTTAPPGPSIQQVAKPVGFGTPIAGATKSGGV